MGNKLINSVASGVIAVGLGAILAQAAAPATPQGVITAKVYLDIGGGTSVGDLTGNAKFPDGADLVNYPVAFELYNLDGTQPPSDVYNNAGAQMVGYFYPDATADYIFYLAADDGANLYLSTDQDPANKKLIAQEAGWSNQRSYTAIGGGSTVEAKNSDTFTGTQWPDKSANGGAKIHLIKGNAYYIEGLQKEGGGGDNLSVSIDGTEPIPGSMLSSFDKTSGNVAITTQPQSVSVKAGEPASFSVVVNGTPPYTYQWLSNNVEVANSTVPSYAIARTSDADNGDKYKVVVTGGAGNSVTSTEVTLTVNTDTVPPTLAEVVPSATLTSLTVVFSEPVDATTGGAAANYKLSGGVTVSAAAVSAAPNDNKVTLTTSKQTAGTELTLTVNNVKDINGVVIAPNSAITFKTVVFETGWASYQRWKLTADPAAIDQVVIGIRDGTYGAPTYESAVTQFGCPWGAADQYVARVYGYFIPPANGDYVFFVGSDDQSQVFLSTDETPANVKLIAQETQWSNQYQFTTTGGGSSLDDKRSDLFAGTEWPTGNTITLQKDKKYYMEVILREGGGGDGVDVTYIRAGDPDPANSAAGMTMLGKVIATYLDPNGASINITKQPVDTTQQEMRTATFTVETVVDSPYTTTASYQWQKLVGAQWVNIDTATKASYTTPILALADTGTKYRVVCAIPTLTVNSAEVTLTVVPDTFPPKLEAAGAVLKGTAIELGVTFDENVDPVSAALAANYSLSKGSVTGVRYQQFAHTGGEGFFQIGTAGPFYGASVVLTTSGLAAGDTVTVTAKNVKDVKGNAMSATGESELVKVSGKMKWVGMGGDDFLQGETGGQNITPSPALWPEDVVAVSDSDFNLISSGTQNWNNYDETTYVYEEVTGDFDKVVRVEYQDPTSQWGRAGMCVTPDPNAGVTRAEVTGGFNMALRYMLRCNPAVQWNGAAGNNQNEADWRDVAGGNYGGTGAGTPAYPNAWLRIQRIGQTFNGFYSADGKNWTAYGSHTFGPTDAAPDNQSMPDKLCVGIYYCPEFLNNTTGEGVGHSTLGKFRQYGDFVSNPSVVDYGIGLNFGADEPSGANTGTLPSIATAGVPTVLQAHWNNLSGASGTSSAIVADKKGASAPTAVTVTWASPNTWSSTGRGEENNQFTGNDKTLMTGYLDTGAATTTTVNIEGIPTDLTSTGYDVYVYALGGVPGRGGGYRIAKLDGTTGLTDFIDAQSPTNPSSFTEVVPAAGQWVAGTYMVFKNLKEASIQVQASTENGHAFGGTPRASLNAVQLVPTGGGPVEPPEITSIKKNADGTITITWTGGGTLQAGTSVLGPWQDVTGATSPYTFTPSAAMLYGRIKQ